MLYILISVWVLRAPNDGQNLLFHVLVMKLKVVLPGNKMRSEMT